MASFGAAGSKVQRRMRAQAELLSQPQECGGCAPRPGVHTHLDRHWPCSCGAVRILCGRPAQRCVCEQCVRPWLRLMPRNMPVKPSDSLAGATRTLSATRTHHTHSTHSSQSEYSFGALSASLPRACPTRRACHLSLHRPGGQPGWTNLAAVSQLHAPSPLICSQRVKSSCRARAGMVTGQNEGGKKAVQRSSSPCSKTSRRGGQTQPGRRTAAEWCCVLSCSLEASVARSCEKLRECSRWPARGHPDSVCGQKHS